MKNNWVLQSDESGGLPDALDSISGDGSEYYEPRPGVGITSGGVSIGDEIESEMTRQWGIVIGIIRSKYGDPVCYKVWCGDDESFVLDYISANMVTMREPCGSAAWSLGRIGYKWFECGDRGEYRNQKTGDVISW